MIETTPHYVWLRPGQELPDIAALAPFKAIVVLAADYFADWQNEVSAWLVSMGCRYMMAWGPNCTAWDDSVDWAALESIDFEEDDRRFVMTTWHPDESLERIFWYSQFCANFSFDEVPLPNAVILDISQADRGAELLNSFEQSKTLAEREAS